MRSSNLGLLKHGLIYWEFKNVHFSFWNRAKFGAFCLLLQNTDIFLQGAGNGLSAWKCAFSVLHSLQEGTGHHGLAWTWTMLSLVTLVPLSRGWRGTCVRAGGAGSGFSCDWLCLCHIELLLSCFKQSSQFEKDQRKWDFPGWMEMFLVVASQTMSDKELGGKNTRKVMHTKFPVSDDDTITLLITLDKQNLVPYFVRIPCGHHGSNGSEVTF